jgi:hypothetical protein
VIQGQKIKTIGIQKYVGRLTEYGRSIRRHSSFWIGLYGQCWAQRSGGSWHGMQVKTLLRSLIGIRRNKLRFFQRGMRAMSFIISMF